MKKVSSLLLVAAIIFSACNQATFKKGKDNLEYKIIPDGSGTAIQYGNYMQIDFATYYNTNNKDSLLSDSRTTGAPIIEILDSVSTPLAYYEILKQLRKGDSVAIRILSDSAFKNMPEQMPPFIKKGHFLVTTVKVQNIFKTREEADSARTAVLALKQQKDSVNAISLMAKDDKEIQDYLAKNKISAVKAPGGTYVQIIEPGTGANIDTASVVKVFYTGRAMSDGIEFDSNMDSSKGKKEPLLINLTNEPGLGMTVIRGWNDGFTMLKKGAVAKLFIPSPLGYGAQASGPIKANAILIFDVKIADVLTKDQAKAAVKVQQDKMQAMQKAYMDSMAKAPKEAPAQK